MFRLLVVLLTIVCSTNVYSFQCDKSANLERDLSLLVKTTAEFRSVGIIDVEKINQFFGADGVTQFNFDIEGLSSSSSTKAMWSYFFRGTQVFHGNINCEVMVAGYYNVILNTWLITEWKRADNVMKLVSSNLWLPDTSMTAGKNWLDALPAVPINVAIQQQTKRNMRYFSDLFPEIMSDKNPQLQRVEELTKPQRQEFAASLAEQHANLLALLENGVFNQAQGLFQSYVELGDAHELMRMSQGEIPVDEIETYLSLPQELRTALVPIFSLRIKSDFFVLSATATQARYFYLSQLSKKEPHQQKIISNNQAPRLSQMIAIDAYQYGKQL
ncbi:MAG: hypothetical protein MI750_03520 [Xanthomonadales bacterium]|nr:hypothetical protein [Xanthomonadales bacterium]